MYISCCRFGWVLLIVLVTVFLVVLRLFDIDLWGGCCFGCFDCTVMWLVVAY